MTTREDLDIVERAPQVALVVAIAGSAMLVARPFVDAFNLPKATLVGLCALVAVVAWAWRGAVAGRIEVPRGVAVPAVVAFLGFAAVAVATSDVPWRSVTGQRERANGFGLYVAAAILFFVAASVARDARGLRAVVRAVVVAAGAVAGYCLLQVAGLDPLSWPAGALPRFSSLGNSNFVSGYLGSTLAVVVLAVLADESRRWRLVAVAVAIGSVLAVLATRSFQGIPAGTVGVAVVTAFAFPKLSPTARRAAVAALVAIVVVVGALTALGLSGSGPFNRLSGEVGFAQRQYYWGAAVSMTAEEPATGVGFDMFGGYYREHRTAEAATIFGTAQTVDDPHSVPLNMFAGGGIPLGLAYLAFVGLVGFSLVRGLRRADAGDRLVLGGIGGAWLGYQVQSLVSIDVPPLATLHWVLAGAVLARSGAISWSGHALPWEASSRRGRGRGSREIATTETRLVQAGIAVVAVIAVVLVTIPVRADRHAQRARSASEPFAQFAALRKAVEIAPWEGLYWSDQAAISLAIGQPREAMRLYERAARRDPRSLAHALNAARTAHASDLERTAARWYERALQLEPNEPDLHAELGRFYLETGAAERAIPLLRDTLKRRSDGVDLRIYLGEALLEVGDSREAIEVLDEALRLRPDDSAVQSRIAQILAEAGEVERAIALLREILRSAPEAAKVMALLGQLLVADGDVEEGLSLLERAAELAPTDTEIAAALDSARQQAGGEP